MQQIGGLARNRTGVHGFAVRCVTTPPRGPRGPVTRGHGGGQGERRRRGSAGACPPAAFADETWSDTCLVARPRPGPRPRPGRSEMALVAPAAPIALIGKRDRGARRQPERPDAAGARTAPPGRNRDASAGAGRPGRGRLADGPPAALAGGFVVEPIVVAIFLAQRQSRRPCPRCFAAHSGRAAWRRPGRAVAKIVGRDVERARRGRRRRAAIESGAENFSDGVVAPSFWYSLLGLPGLFFYKTINTADSMIGHRNDALSRLRLGGGAARRSRSTRPGAAVGASDRRGGALARHVAVDGASPGPARRAEAHARRMPAGRRRRSPARSASRSAGRAATAPRPSTARG